MVLLGENQCIGIGIETKTQKSTVTVGRSGICYDTVVTARYVVVQLREVLLQI